MATRSLNVQITGDAKSLGVAARQADGHMDGLGKSATRMGKVMAVGFASAGAAAAGVLAVGLKKSVEAAMEAEKSQARLQAQLKASGISYRAHAKEIDAVIQKHSQLAGLDDEDLQDAFTNIVRVTNDVDKSMRLVGLAADFARAKHMDVAKAGELVGKVAGGNTGILGRYGIKIKEGATATEALGLLQQKFAGQAEAYGKTAAGAQDRFGVAVENLQEKLGARLLPTVARVTNSVADFISGMESGKGTGGRFAEGVSTAMNQVRAVVGRVRAAITAWVNKNRGDIDSVVSAFKAVGRFAQAVFIDTVLPIVRRLAKQIAEQLAGIISVVRGLVRLVSGLLSGDWAKAWDGAKEIVKGAWKVIYSAIKTTVGNIWELIKDLGPDLVKLLVKGIANVGKALATGIYEGVKYAVQHVPGMIGGLLGGLGKKIVGALIPGGDGIGKAFGRAVGDGVGRGTPKGSFSGDLHGADQRMGPFARIAGRFGLGISSGRNDHSKMTAAGYPSYHGSGEALDFSNGYETPQEMSFARYMVSNFGGRLAELIYTPLGFSIKDGRRVAPIAASDHHDHVHVAFDLGRPGVGIGDGIGRTGARTGDGVVASASRLRGYAGFAAWARRTGLSHQLGTGGWFNALAAYARSIGADPKKVQRDHGAAAQDPERWKYRWTGARGDGSGRRPFTGDGIGDAVNDARSAGWSGTNLVNAIAIAARESSYDEDAHNYNPPIDDSWGYMQINVLPNANPQYKNWNLKDGQVNFKAARELFNASGWAPWGGRGISPFHGVTPAMFARARQAVLGSRGDSSSSGSNSSGGEFKPSSGVGKITGPNTAGGVGSINGGLGQDPQGKGGHRAGATGPGGYSYQGALDSIGLARSQSTSDTRTVQLNAAEGIALQRRLRKIMAALKGRLGPSKRSELMQEAASINDRLRTLGEETNAIFNPAVEAADTSSDAPLTPEDWALSGLARARANGDKDAELTALTSLRDIAKDRLRDALANSDPRDDMGAYETLTSAESTLKEFVEAVNANTDALKEQREQFEQLIAEDYRTKYNVSQSQYGILAQAITDVVSIRIGSTVGLAFSGLRAPAGSTMRA